MTDSEDATDFVEELDADDIQQLADRLESELESNDRERIDASLGMFTLSIESHGSLDETVAAFEDVWNNRIDEIEESRADTVRQKLDEDDSILFPGP